MALAQAQALLASFTAEVDGGSFDAAQASLTKLKILITQLPTLPPAGNGTGANAADERAVAQRALEYAVLLAAKREDVEAFECQMSQLKPYYADDGAAAGAAPSAARCLVVGMNLLHLLMENRLAEFHSELELTTEADRADAHVQFALGLEQRLMEGSYGKVLEAKGSCPAEFAFFMGGLVERIRDLVAEVSEAAYGALSLAEAQRLLHFGGRAELLAYIAERQGGWVVDAAAGSIVFDAKDSSAVKGKGVSGKDIPSFQLIKETLLYATELDRIV